MNTTETKKARWCTECYGVSTPTYTLKRKEYLIKGKWLKIGVPSEQMLCGLCKKWVDSRAAEDIR